MSDLIQLDIVDSDGAIREAEEAVAGDSRADFFRKAALTGGAAIGGGVLMGGFPSIAAAAPSKKNDLKILNYALTLEYLESAFYKEALQKAGLTGDVESVTKVVDAHEVAHVKFLKKALGKSAVKKPSFDFQGTTSDLAKYLATAVVLEDTGVSAYAGQGPLVKQKAVAVAALSILTIEARHAAAFRTLAKSKGGFAPKSFDKAASMKTVLAAVKKTKFIKA